MKATSVAYLKQKIQDLRQKLRKAEEALRCFGTDGQDSISDLDSQDSLIPPIASIESLYRVMVDAMAEGALTATREGVILFSNQRFASIVGKPLKQVVGTNLNQLVVPEDLHTLSALLATQTPERLELRLQRESPPLVVPATLSANTLVLDGKECVCLVLTDLTEFRNAENELHRSQDMLRLIIDALPLSLYWKGKDGKFQGCNSHFLADSGFTRQEEIVGLEDRDMPWGDQAARFESLEKQLAGGGGKGGFQELTFDGARRIADGTEILTASTRVPLRDETGGFAGIVGMYQDVTAQKATENHLLQVRKMESVGRLAGGVAHDFNNLLTVINGYGDILLAAMTEGDPLRPWVANIREASGLATQLTSQLMAFSRQQPISPKLLNVRRWLSDSTGLLCRLLGEDIKLSIEEPGPFGIVLADENQLQQVLINLAVNARDAMPSGGRLTIRTENVEVDQGSAVFQFGCRAGQYVLLSFTDTGMGMNEHTRAHLFEPFFTTKPLGQGTGFGLSTVYGIVKQAGGEIWVSNTSDRGSTFEVYLPRVDSTAEEAPPKESFPWPLVGTETVLVVDDHRSVRDLIVKYLADFGYRIIAASSHKNAVAAAKSHAGKIHLLVTDVVMPDVNGKHLHEKLKRSHPEMKVLFVSGYTSDVISNNGVIDSGLNFISKPFSALELARKVREVLGYTEPGFI